MWSIPTVRSVASGRRVALALSLLGLPGAIVAQGPPPAAAAAATAATQPDTSAITPELIERGRKLYRGKGLCATCHGMKLEGTPIATAHRKDAGWKYAKDGAFPELVRVVATGVPGTVMVAYPNGLTPDDGIAVAAYIWAVNHRSVKP